MKHLFGLALMSALMLAVGACSTLPSNEEAPVKDPAAAWRQHRADMTAIRNWDIEGRIAIRSYNEAVNANLHWRQHGDHYEIDLSGPFGSGAVYLSGGPDAVRLKTHDRDMVADNAESLLYQVTGLMVPIESLKYWIRGLPQPDSTGARNLDPQGRLAQLEQDRWKVRFRAYTRVSSQQLPEKVFVDDHRLSVRIVIDKWSLPQS